MNEYQFTQDWFHWAPEVWQQLIPLLPNRDNFLEIGSFEGRSTVWITENMASETAYIDCIDTWEGGEEHGAEDMSAVEKRFDYNINLAMEKHQAVEITKYKGTSRLVLSKIYSEASHPEDILGWYDFIYIDGSHIAKDVLTDACMAWPLLKPTGVMVFDDYVWGPSRDILHRPKLAIDAFMNIFAEEVEIVHVGYQMVIRKRGA